MPCDFVPGMLGVGVRVRAVAGTLFNDRRQMTGRVLYLPSVFPHLVTGWVTAAGGAWNASIVSELVTVNRHTTSTWGLGAQINEAAATANFPLLAASVVLMSLLVVIFNRLVWARLV